ncbi:hypothetical protein BKD30_08160 [Tersicoccus phoenicis]|uniref:DUF218 domain-containing protein n=1 Tax=Tersicoccus phoenicis TaxID=554083 RepID=A0A1R1LAH5_9MICC|nr:ElyC/SanA/YdcF family protein [Tersicoccus phoenicis]OMH24541.1 hypothetical protein BKD30_08160 [Tersicoccus phoenicis]
MPSANCRPRRLVLRGTCVVVVTFLVWLVACLALFVGVESGFAPHTDAVVMLGGASRERLPVADDVRAATGMPILVLSHTDTLGNASADARCRRSPQPTGEICFRPVTDDTGGEARAIGKLIAQHHWTSVTVVTSRYHATRARMLIGSCTDARISMVVSEPQLNPWQWFERFVSESGGLVEAVLAPPCS